MDILQFLIPVFALVAGTLIMFYIFLSGEPPESNRDVEPPSSGEEGPPKEDVLGERPGETKVQLSSTGSSSDGVSLEGSSTGKALPDDIPHRGWLKKAGVVSINDVKHTDNLESIKYIGPKRAADIWAFLDERSKAGSL